jgi:monoamine oxidase
MWNMERPNEFDIIIIGAGAAGLAASMELSKAGKKVLTLEARDRIGGRIYTTESSEFSQPIEAGAEFIHGQLPVTIDLLRKADLNYELIKGNSWKVTNGIVQKDEEFIEGWDVLIKKLKALKEDQTIANFLHTHFIGAQYKELRTSTLQYTEGYNAADPDRASTFALREEWESEDEEHQYRIKGGYGKLVHCLQKEIEKAGGSIYLSSMVTEIRWKKQEAEVVTADHHTYYCKQVLVTVPLGVLQADNGSEGTLAFSPALPEHARAVQQMGFGAALKVQLQFQENFWEGKGIRHAMKNAGFIYSDAFIPTWWTQNPNHNGLLTGWLAGPKAYKLKNYSDDLIYEKAIDSLCYIFSIDKTGLHQRLQAHQVHNWVAQPFSKGAYSYTTLHTKEAIKVLSKPVEETIYFAGEALYTGKLAGTVEVALRNGFETAQEMSGWEPNIY